MMISILTHPGWRGVMCASLALAAFDSQSVAANGLSALKKIQEVHARLKAVEFTSDHNLLHEDGSDLRFAGDRLADVEWESTRGRQVARLTHTAARNLEARALVSLNFLPAGTTVRVVGESEDGHFCLNGSSKITFGGVGPCMAVVPLTAKKLMPASLSILQGEVHWQAEISIPGENTTSVELNATTYLECYLTRGTPRTEKAASEVTAMRLRESYRRLEYATSHLGADASIVAIVHALTSHCGRYYNPQQHFERQDAWYVPNTWRYRYPGASCISICNYCSLILDQIGMEGEYKQLEIYARPDNPTKAIEGGVTSEDYVKDVDWQRWQLFLVDDRSTRWGQVGSYGGMNNYEACIAYTWQGKTYYFPGGTDRVYDHLDQVLCVFRTLVWARWDPRRNNWQVMEVVHTYNQPGHGVPGNCKIP